jgi:putative ABC transport system permease protein
MFAWLRTLASRMAALFRGARSDRELDDELRFHLEMQTELNLRKGMSPEEARRRAFIALGGIEKSREEYRQVRTLRLVENLAADVRFAWRMIVREPRFSAMLILVLALGIGCATAMFSVVDRLLLRPVPSPVADRLVTVMTTGGIGREPDYWAQNPALDGIAQFRLGETNLTSGQTVERVKTGLVSSNFFPLLEVRPLFGRLFLPEEASAGHAQVVILSYATWLRRYGGDRAVLGRSLTLNGITHTIIGVMRPGFRFPPQTEVWAPYVRRGGSLAVDRPDHSGDMYGGATIGRLRQGATLEQARAAYTVLFVNAQAQERKGTSIGQMRAPELYQGFLTTQLRLPLLVLFGATGFVLLISCANAANLLLARAAVRRKEIAVRVCLGAGRVRILRQLLTESSLMAIAGGALGALLSFVAVGTTRALGAHYISNLAELSVNGRLLVFALGVSLIAGIGVGLAPALQSFAPDVSRALKQEGMRTSGSVRQVMRKILVAGQVALGVVLVVGAALMLQSLHRLMSVDKGFDEQNVVVGRLTLPVARYKEPQQRAAYWERLQNEIRRVPGVTVTALSVGLPFINLGCGGGALDLGVARGPIDKRYLDGGCTTVSADYFKALGVPLRAGRLFNDGDGPAAPKVMIINEQLARMAWPGQNPIGQQVQIEMEKEMRQVVGVSENVKFWSLDDRDRPLYYIPYLQPFRASADLSATPFGARLVARTVSDPEKLIATLQRAVLSVDREVPLLAPQTMEDLISDSIAAPRYRAWLLTGFGLAALLLAALGVYGVVSYSVACRRHELGVRISLGAQRPDILKLIAGEGARVALAGAIIGLLVARALTGLVTKLLFGVAPTDLLTFVAAAVVLVAGALAASLIPALRACKLDPVAALRCE